MMDYDLTLQVKGHRPTSNDLEANTCMGHWDLALRAKGHRPASNHLETSACMGHFDLALQAKACKVLQRLPS